MQSRPAARALILDLGGVVLRNARELVQSRSALGAPAVTAYADAVDFAGPRDERRGTGCSGTR